MKYLAGSGSALCVGGACRRGKHARSACEQLLIIAASGRGIGWMQVCWVGFLLLVVVCAFLLPLDAGAGLFGSLSLGDLSLLLCTNLCTVRCSRTHSATGHHFFHPRFCLQRIEVQQGGAESILRGAVQPAAAYSCAAVAPRGFFGG